MNATHIIIALINLFSVSSFAETSTSISYNWAQHTNKKPEVLIHVLDINILNALEVQGFSFSETLSVSPKTTKALETTFDLYKNNPMYKAFANQIGKAIPHNPKTDQLPEVIPANYGDIPEMVRLVRNFEDKGKRSAKDLKDGYYIRKLSNNSQYPYAIEYDGDEPRHFDYRWLNSKFGYFKLIAVVNRMDRIDFYPNSCGEVRFIYRLSYKSPNSSSSLPFFVNVVYQYPKKKSCAAYAQNWMMSLDKSKKLVQAKANAQNQFINQLKNLNFKDLSFKQLEVNFQSLRFTSGYMHDFGGQAMYMFRLFRFIQGKLSAVELENTPNVLAIEKDPEILKQFVQYLKKDDNLEKLDQGTLLIDFNPKFLAKQAVSWATLGRARLANKPFSRLFKNNKTLLESIDISKLKHIKNHNALVERLNNITCMGCHQSSSTAGFHMLGFADPKFSHGFNRQELPFSGHAFAESIRRKAYIEALAQDAKPNTFKPHSNFSKAIWINSTDIPNFQEVQIGEMCLTGKNFFSNGPKCVNGSTCQQNVTSKMDITLFGECIANNPLAGSTCWQGEIKETPELPKDRTPIPSYNFFAFQDKFNLMGAVKNNPAYKCVLPQSGAPLGRSSRSCSLAEENLENITWVKEKFPAEICGNQGGNGFDLCAASGDSGSCLEARVVRSMLDTCHTDRFCREDYICQKLPDYHKISELNYTNKKNGKSVNLSKPQKIKGDVIVAAHKNHIGFCVPTYFLFNMRIDGHPSPVTGLPPGVPKIDRTQPLRGYYK